MGLTSPYDTVYKMTTLARWQRDWVNAHRSINYSGMVQELIIQVIKKKDPDYFEAHKDNLRKREVRRKESTEFIITLFDWADNVKNRDVSCKICGTSEQLEAHHIFQKSIYPDMKLIENNGITLCRKHHYEAHGKKLFA